jgi:hypothetical protein
MQQILVNEATNGDKRIFFYLVDDTDGKTPETLVVPSASELQISQNGGSFANFAGTWTEVGSGFYYYTPTVGEVNQQGILVLKLVKTGIRTYAERVQIVTNDPYGVRVVTLQGGSIGSGTFATDAISSAAVSAAAATKIASAVLDEPMTAHTTANSLGEHFGGTKRSTIAASGSNTALTFLTNLTEVANDFWKDTLIVFVSGALDGQVKKVSAYNGTTKFITVSTAFTSAPAASDAFLLINS